MKLSRLIIVLCLSTTIIPFSMSAPAILPCGFWLRAGAAHTLWHCANQGIITKADRFSPGRLLLQGISRITATPNAATQLLVQDDYRKLNEGQVFINRVRQFIENKKRITIETDGPCPIATAELVYVVCGGHSRLFDIMTRGQLTRHDATAQHIDMILEQILPFGSTELADYTKLIRINMRQV